jgi:[ribosomal protein S5]-alanine N-acetyltransferase
VKTALAPCAGETELSDAAVTGQFASAMAAIAAMPHVPPWCGYIGRRDRHLVGFGGFKGAPVDGVVEIGYLTFPAHEGTGVATDITALMLEIAREVGVTLVLAHTLPEENASTTVLRKCGFAKIGVTDDPDDGVVWRWERVL